MENQQQQNTPLCRANCGFYGSPATEDMCSKCFKDMIKRKQETGITASTTTTGTMTSSTTAAAAAVAVALAASDNSAAIEQRRSSSSPANAQLAAAAPLSGTTASTSNPAAVPPLFSVHSGATSAASTPTIANETNVDSSVSPSPVSTTQQQADQHKKKPNRCGVCSKRVGLTGFECRCGGLFCGEHRYDSAHNCTFDYKTAGREELRAKHPQVISDKIERI